MYKFCARRTTSSTKQCCSRQARNQTLTLVCCLSVVLRSFVGGCTLNHTEHLIMSSWLSQCFSLIGLIVVLRLVLTITKGIWVYFLRPGQNLRKLGSWAVVTGATDGIGRALCDNLARKGNHCSTRRCRYASERWKFVPTKLKQSNLNLLCRLKRAAHFTHRVKARCSRRGGGQQVQRAGEVHCC